MENIILIVVGLITLCFALFMQFKAIRYIPAAPIDKDKNPYGFKKRIIWLELVDNIGEVFHILDDPETEQGKLIRERIIYANKLDNIFSLIYPLYNVSIFYFVHSLTNYKFTPFFIFGLGLSVLMIVSDLLENREIKKIIQLDTNEAVKNYNLFSIQLWAIVKWVAIALSCLLISIFYFSYLSFDMNIILAVLYLITGSLIFLTISIRSIKGQFQKAFTLLFIVWFITWIHSLILFF